MTPKTKITIAGLGAGAPGDITLAAWEALKTSSNILLRTAKHPVVDWLRREGFSFSTFDCFYESASSFNEVYRRIAEAVIAEAGRGPVLYAVPGHPMVEEESVNLIVEQAGLEGIEITFLPAVSFLDALFSAIRLNPGTGLQIIDGLRLDAGLINSGGAVVITQVYSRLASSDVKLTLLDTYDPEHPVTVIRGAGIPGAERIATVPLYELDRGNRIPVAGKDETVRTGTEDTDWQEDRAEAIQTYENEELGCNPDVFAGGQAVPGEYDAHNRACRYPLDSLVDVMTRLRGKEGCPWDREQDHHTLKPYLLEETYEVLDALSQENMYKTCEELGDLLLQIAFHAQIASETGCFDINDVVAGITEKMVRRHPHVFGAVKVRDSSEVVLNWEKIKQAEKQAEKAGNAPRSLLSDVAQSLPALMRAAKIQKKAARVGFDWPDYRGGLDKIREELVELELIITGNDKLLIEEELGDLLFSVVNLARLLGVEPETALASTNEKFVRRFNYIEKMVQQKGGDFSRFTLSELDAWWEEAKKMEKF
ncbi:MAG: hypothetical protein XD97_0664 [Pelotomaculum thermopropionicum]|uniref:Nucleoside triphosphate pyrophosphohydrolase n=1 Tax=Pelotomaculum thermopropionicum TaxID=110500 RepID=A0A101HR84_9FIRM|nr:MAG: hypothetical protein XD97_0664 [Pelotomaculum thermopropionicum]